MVSLRFYANMPTFATEKLVNAMPSFATEEFADAIGGAYGDLSLKRNLGLLIGRMAGWKTLLFVDDDIIGLSAAKVRRVAGALENFAAAGMPATEFPDNSVVCHARRRFVGGEPQDVFVSGSALAVNVETADSFFPAVYNEDWLFLAPHLDRRSVTSGGPSGQKPYYPFGSPARATRQEFGDVLAEGLIGHLHTGTLERLPTRRYWAAFLSRRADLIAASVAGCHDNKQSPIARDAIRALDEAEKARSVIEPIELVQYLEAWQSDLTDWRRHIQRFTTVGSLEKALGELGLLDSAMSVRGASRRRKAGKSRNNSTLAVAMGEVSSSR